MWNWLHVTHLTPRTFKKLFSGKFVYTQIYTLNSVVNKHVFFRNLNYFRLRKLRALN